MADRGTESMDLSDIPPPTTTISTVAVQAGRAKVVLAVLRSTEWVRVRVHQMEPDLMDVGSNLEEALQLQREHEQLMARLKSKEDEVHQLLRTLDVQADENRSQVDVHNAMADTLAEAWKDLNDKLAYRGTLLSQSVAFHQSAQDLSQTMEQAQRNFSKVPLATDVDTAQRLLQQHLDMKNSILETSKTTLDMGQSLLDQIKEMGMHADFANLHATTAACYGIEHLLELLHDRRRHLEELWNQRKIRLEHCLQLCRLDQDVNKILEWYRGVGSNYLHNTELGSSYLEAQQIQKDHNQFEAQAREVQENMLSLLRTADGLLRRASVDAESIRQRLIAVDREAESFTNRLDIRRKNISMAVAFFRLAETALNKLGEVEFQLNNMDLPRNSAELAEHHSRLSQAIVDYSTEAIHEGRLLLERVSSVDPGADGIRQKMDELITKCTQLEALCKSRRAEAWQRSQDYLTFQEKYNSLQTWLHQIGLNIISRHNSLGTTLASAKDFLEVHEQLDEDIRDKNVELSALSAAASKLVQSGDQGAQQAADRARDLEKQYQRLQSVVENRIQLALMYVSFHRLAQQLSSNLDGLEHIVRSETEDLQEITDTAVQNLRDMFSNTRHIFDDLNLKGNEFLQNATMIHDDSSLEIRSAVQTVEHVLSDQRMNSVTRYWEAWEQHVMSSKQFKSQWHQFIQEARKTIDRVMQIENDFFPLISGELGDSLQQTRQLQARLDQFVPIYQEAQAKIEEHLKTAELLSLKGDTKGQKDQIINELVKVHQRFQSRINEYQILLKMTIEFYKHIGQLDDMIERTEREYLHSQLPTDLNQAESMLDQHKRKKTEVSQFINYTAEEGDRIVRRVRQQDAGAAASDDIRHVLDATSETKRRWDNSWEEQERRLRQNLQICQFNFDLRQIHSEIDQLHHHLQSRRGNYGTSLPNAQITSQAFKEFEKTVEVIEDKINNFISTAELMVQDKHYDSDNIRSEVDVLRNKWSTFHSSVKDYRNQLDASILYFTLIEECERWMREGSQLLIDTGHKAPQCKTPQDAENLIKNLEKFVEQGKTNQEQRLQKVSDLANHLYGDQGANKIRPLVIQYQDMMQSFEQADNELSLLKENLEGKSPPSVEEFMSRDVSAKAAVPQPRVRPPKIVQHLKNAEVTEGDKFTFECRVDSDQVPEVQWYKDNLPLTSPDYETRFMNGIATLTIEETFSEDTARYTCRFTNDAGMAESSAYLSVRETHQQFVPPEFTRNLKSLDLPEGSPHSLECHVTGIPSPTISWYKDDINIDNSPEYVITKINGTCTLKIRQLQRHHSARYTCRALNPGGEASSSARLTVIPTEMPTIQQPLRDVTCQEGKTLHLEVRFTGSPPPEVIWFRGSNRVVPNNMCKITVTVNFSSLDIREAYPEDSGSYTVIVRNVAGEATSVCQVIIEPFYSSPGDEVSQASAELEAQAPQFVQKLPPTKVAPEGTRVRLDCILIGHPEPEVIWFKNDKPIKESQDIQLLFEGDRCTLIIREAIPNDDGHFKCVAQNPQGVAETTCKLHIEPVSEMSDASVTEVAAPKFSQLLKDQHVKSGQRICLQCRVIGHPLPSVTWFRDNHALESSPDFQITAFADVHSLTIPEVFDEDSGNYAVRAVNSAGEATCVAKLTVEPPPPEEEAMERKKVLRREQVPQNPPEFRRLFQDVTAKPGDSVTFECSVTGSPKPKITWHFNGEPLVSQDYITGMDGDTYRLTIPEVFDEDAGRFSLTAENPSGKATCSALLSVAPGLPLVPAPSRTVQRTTPMSVDHLDGYPSWSESEITQTVTKTEKRVSHTYMSEDRYFSSGGESHHSTTFTTEVKPKKRATLSQRYATTVTTDIPPKFQPVDLTIEVPIPPNFIQPLRSIQAVEGTRVTFEGIVTGKPEPVIRWYREGKQLSDQADFEISYRSGRVAMSIPEVFAEDSGKFTCTAENPSGKASSSAELVVRATLIPPAFTEKLKTQRVQEREPVRLVVRVSGEPPPTVSWYRDGSRLVSSPDFHITQEGDIHGLYIPEFFYEDTGKFSVKAENPAGEAICSAHVHVQPVSEKPQPLAIRAPERKPVYEPVTPTKSPAAVSPRPPIDDQPVAKIPKLQRPSDFIPTPAAPSLAPEERYRHELDMQIEHELPPFEARIKLFTEEAYEAPPPQPQFQPRPQPVQEKPFVPTKKVPAEERPFAPAKKVSTEEKPFAPAKKVPAEEKPFVPAKKVPAEERPFVPAKKVPAEEKPFVTDKQKPAFTKPLRDIWVKEGDRLVLEITFEGHPEPVVRWYRETIEIKNSPDYQIIQEKSSSSLIITEVFPEDSGRYEAVVMNAEGVTRTQAFVRVDAAPPPPLPKEPPPPLPKPVYRDGIELQIDKEPSILPTFEKKVELFSKVPPPSAVTLVRRPPPSVISEKVRPVFSKPLTNIEAKQGDKIIFEVKVQGNPEPVVKWFREDIEIVSSPDFELSRTDTVYRLQISEVFPEDAGKFTCTASNALGTETTEAYLYVQPSPLSPVQSPVAEERFREELEMQVKDYPELPLFEKRVALFGAPPKPMPPDMAPRRPFVTDKVKPTFTKHLKNTYAKQGEPVVLEVTVEGHPEPIIKWYREGIEISSSPDYSLSRSNKTYRLTISEVFPEDAGKFKVIATNAEGSVTSEANLMVEPGPLSPQEPAPPQLPAPVPQPVTPVSAVPKFTPPPPQLPPPAPQPVTPVSAVPKFTPPPPPATVPPSFVQRLPDVRMVEGTNIKLECRVLGKPFPQVIFTKQGKPVLDGPRHRVTVDERTGRCTLLITKAHPDDEGEYTCTAMNPAGEVATSGWVTHEGPRVQEPMEEDISPLQRFLQEEQSRKPPTPEEYSPKIERRPSRSVERRISSEPEFVVSSFERRLMDEIEYREGKVRLQSETETEYDTDQPEERVPSSQAQAPQFVQPLKDFRLIEGSDVTFVCKVIGRPRPKIAWYKDGQRVRRSTRYEIKYTQDGYCTLRIRSGLKEDTGHYTVLAVNSVGKTTCSGQLFIDAVGIIDATSFVSPETLQRILRRDSLRGSRRGSEDQGGVFETISKPEFKKIPESLEVREGNPVRLDCLVLGRPVPELLWYRNGEPVHSNDNHKVVVNEDGVNSLLIISASRHDAGTYTCVARNRGGEDTFTVNLNILEREQMQPPRFIDRMQNYTVVEGHPVTLTCLATGVPTPMMSWQKDGRMLSELDYRIETNGGRSTLYIDSAEVSDSAWFQCSAVSVAGTATTRSKLVVERDLTKTYQTQPAEVSPRRVTSPQYEIQPEGPVQQISYATERDSATLRLIKEEELKRPQLQVASRILPPPPPAAPAPTPETSTPMLTEEEDDYQRKSVSDAKKLFSKTDEVPRAPPPKLQKPSKPITVLFKPREPSPSYDINRTGPVQLISYASDSERGYLRLVDEEDLPRKVPTERAEPEPSYLSEARKEPKLKPVTAIIKIPPPPVPPKPERVISSAIPTATGAPELTPFEAVIPIKPKQREFRDYQESAVREHIRREGEAPPIEDVYDKEKQKPALFKTQIQDLYLKENDAAHFECKLLPYGDPTMKVEWFKDGEPLHHGTRYKPAYDFGFVTLDIMWMYPEDSGVYECQATNDFGQSATSSTVVCRPLRSIILDTQLPAEGAARLQEMEEHWRSYMSVEERVIEEPETKSPPSIDLKPEPVETGEGEPAKFLVKVSGYPRPRVNWWINGSLIVGSTRFKLTYDGMMHYLEIPRCREYDAGQIKVVAKNSEGEEEAITSLTIMPKEDWRSKLKQAPKGELEIELERRKKIELRSVELDKALKKPKATEFELRQLERATETKYRVQKDTEIIMAEQQYISVHTQLRHKDGAVISEPVHVERARLVPISQAAPGEDKQVVEEQITLQRGEPPVFTKPLRPVRMPEGNSVTLEVHFKGIPPPVITWYRDSFEIQPSRDFQISTTETTSTLHIPEVFIEDAGMFTVKAYNKFGLVQCKAKLTVEEGEQKEKEVPPEFRSLTRDTRVVQGEPVTFDCQITGTPTPQVHWTKEGHPLPESPRWKFIKEDNNYTLVIYEVQPLDAGVYACVAINTVGKATCTARLTVEKAEKPIPPPAPERPVEASLEPPYVVEEPQMVEVEEGEPVRFVCTIKGKPHPVVTWYRNNQLVKPSKYFRMDSSTDGVHTLTIMEAFPEDTGTYKCVARNKAGEVTVVTHLKVHGIESEPEPSQQEPFAQPPSFIRPISNMMVTEGTPAKFEAVFSGVPTPEITWIRNGIQTLHDSREYKIETIDRLTNLTIYKAHPEDTGMITCRAKNQAGTAECSAELYVQAEEETRRLAQQLKITVAQKPPEFVRPLPPYQEFTIGETIRLEAEIVGEPIPSVTWYKDGIEIHSTERTKTSHEDRKTILIIIDVTHQDAGEYVLKVENELGEITCRTTLVVKGREKEVEIPGMETDSVLTITKTVTTVQREEQVVLQQVKPRFVAPLEPEIYVRERGIARLECQVDSIPPPLVTWFVNGMEIKPSPHYEIRFEDGKSILLIIEVGPQDTGEYTCKAVSELGEAVSSTTLYVEEPAQRDVQRPEGTSTLQPSPAQILSPPIFIETMQDVTAVDGQELHLKCRVSGTPMPTVSFFHDSKNIDDDEEFVISYNPETGQVSLIIVEVFPEDQGQYICIARNPAGQATTSAYLTVQETKETAMELEVEQPQEEVTITDTSAPQQIEFVVKPLEQAVVETQPSEAVEEAVVPEIIERPKVEPLEKEEPMQESPIFSPIPDSVTSVADSSDTYYTAQEEIEEDVTEPFIMSKTIDRPKVAPLVPEEITESPEREIVTEELSEEESTPQPEEPIEEVTEVILEKVTLVKEIKIPEVQEEAPQVIPKQEVSIEQVPTEIREVTLITEEGPAEIVHIQPEEPVEVVKMDVDVTDSGIPTPPDAGPLEEEAPIQPTIGVVTEVQDIEQPPQQIIPEQAPDEVAPEFIEMLQPQVVNDGDSLTMTCRLIGSPHPVVTWYKNTTEITSGPDISLHYEPESGQCTLQVTEVFPDDAGEITCRAQNQFGEALTSATLIIQETEESEITTTEETTTTETIITTTSTLQVEQERDEETEVKVADEKHLTILEISPSFTKPLHPTTQADEGGTVRLEVSVVAQPEATVKWYKDEIQITPSERVEVIREKNTYILIITDVRPEDSGDYICEAENVVGRTVCKTTLTVNPLQRMEIEIQPDEMPKEQQETKPKEEAVPVIPKLKEEVPRKVPQETVVPEEGIEGQPPKFTELLQPKTVRDTERVELRVRFTGIPVPTITWYFDGSPIKPSTDFQITIDVERRESTLIIVEVFPEDEGEYTCIAVNPFGEAITTCRLTVVSEETQIITDEIHKETIEIDHSRDQVMEGPEETKVKEVIDIETLTKLQPQPQTFEIQIGVTQPPTTSTVVIQETTTYTQVTKEYVEEMPSVTEGLTTQTTTVSMKKDEQLVPVELRLQIPVQPTEEFLDHITEATRTVTEEIKSVPVSDTSLPTETHTETIEITQQQPEKIPVTVTTTTTSQVTETVEATRATAQRIEVEIHETTLQRQPQVQELQIPIGKVSRTEIEIAEKDEGLESPRPTEEKIEEIRTTITKETKIIQVTPQPQKEEIKMTFAVSSPQPEVVKDIEETEVKVPEEEVIREERDTIETTVIPSEADLVSFVETVETAEDKITLEETELKAPIEEVLETPRETLEAAPIPAEVTEISEDKTEVVEIQIGVEKPEISSEIVIETRVERAETAVVPTEVEMAATPERPEEAEKFDVIPAEQPTEITAQVDTEDVEMVIQIPSEVTEVEEEKQPEVGGPIEEQIMETSEVIVVTSLDTEVEKVGQIPSEVVTEEEKKEEETVEIKVVEEHISVPESETIIPLETHIPAAEEESQIQPQEEVIEEESVITVDLTETEVTEVTEVTEEMKEEVTLQVQVLDEEGIKPELIETETREVDISETKEIKETHKEEIELEIPGKPKELEQVQFSVQLQPEHPVVIQEELMETETSVSEVDVTKQETLTVDEVHREELSFQIQGKPQKIAEMTLTLQVGEKKPEEEEVLMVDTQTVVAEQVIQVMQESQGRAPEFTWGLMSLKVMDGEEVKFRCEVTGEPMPEVSWFHDDKIITENQDFNLTYDTESGSCTLLIAEVFPQDAGEYKCVAVNQYGEAVTRAYLEVESYEYMADTEEASDSMMSSLEPSSPKPTPADSDTEAISHSKEFVEEVQKLQEKFAELTEAEEEVPTEHVTETYSVAHAEVEQQPDQEQVTEIAEEISDAIVESAEEAIPTAEAIVEDTQFQAETIEEVPQEEITVDTEVSLPAEETQEREVPQELAVPTEKEKPDYKVDIIEEIVSQPEISDVIKAKPEEVRTTELVVELTQVTREEKVFKTETVQEVSVVPEVLEVEEQAPETVKTSEIVIDLNRPVEGQPDTFKTEVLEEVVTQPEVIDTTAAVTDVAQTSEILIDLSRPSQEQPETYQTETVEEIVTQPQVSDVTDAQQEEAKLSAIHIELAETTEQQLDQYKTELMEEIITQPEVTPASEIKESETQPSEIQIELAETVQDQPEQYRTEEAEEVVTQPEVSDVTEAQKDEAQPYDIQIELIETRQEYPEVYKTDVTEEIVAQPQVSGVIQAEAEEIQPSEVLPEYEKPSEEQPDTYKTEEVEELVSQPEFVDVTEVQKEEILPSEISVQFEKPSEEQPDTYKTEVILEVVTQPEVSEITESQKEEAQPLDIIVEAEKPSEEQPETYQTDILVEVVQQPEVSDVSQVQIEEVQPGVISYDLDKPSEEHIDTYKTEIVEEAVSQPEVVNISEIEQEEVHPSEIEVDLSQPSSQYPGEYQTDIVEETVTTPQVGEVTTTESDQAVPSQVITKISTPVEEQTEVYKTEVTEETVTQPDVADVTEATQDQAVTSEIVSQAAQPDLEQPLEYHTDVVEETVTQHESADVTSETLEVAQPSEISVELSKPSAEQPKPYETEIVEETLAQPDVTDVEEADRVEAKTSEIVTETEESVAEQPETYQTGLVEEEISGQEITVVTDTELDKLQPSDILVDVTEAAEEKPDTYQTDVLEELILQPDVSETTVPVSEEAPSEEVALDLAVVETRDEEQFQTLAITEISDTPELLEVSTQPSEDLQPAEIVVEFEKPTEEQPQFETGFTEEVPEEAAVSEVEAEVTKDIQEEEIPVKLEQVVQTSPEEAEIEEAEITPEQPEVTDIYQVDTELAKEQVEEFAEEFVRKVIADVRELQPKEEPVVPEEVPSTEEEQPQVPEEQPQVPEEQPEAPEEQPEQAELFVSEYSHDVLKEDEATVRTEIAVETTRERSQIDITVMEKPQDETVTVTETEKITETQEESVEQPEAPRFITTLREITVMENTKMVLEVVFTGRPAPSVVWYVDDEELVPAEDLEIVTESNRSVLTISEVYSDDEGEYKVELTNEVGRSVSSAYISILPITKVPAQPTTEGVEEITITREEIVEEPTSLDFEIQIKEEEEVTTEIVLEETTKETPAEVEAIFEVPEAPRFTQTLQKELVVLEGSNITLVCFVVGKPMPTVTWFKEEEEITLSTRYISTYESGKCTLTINNVTFDEEAEFICQATNEAGSVTTFVDIFVEKSDLPVRKLIREEYYRMEIELEIHWHRRKSQQAPDPHFKITEKSYSFKDSDTDDVSIDLNAQNCEHVVDSSTSLSLPDSTSRLDSSSSQVAHDEMITASFVSARKETMSPYVDIDHCKTSSTATLHSSTSRTAARKIIPDRNIHPISLSSRQSVNATIRQSALSCDKCTDTKTESHSHLSRKYTDTSVESHSLKSRKYSNINVEPHYPKSSSYKSASFEGIIEHSNNSDFSFANEDSHRVLRPKQ